MKFAGWIFISVFWGLVIILNAFCFGKILRNRHKHGQE
jgi:glycerol uptake facilitator-like aquaporin